MATPIKSPLTKNPDGSVTWVHQEGDKYVVTGTCRDGSKIDPRTFDSYQWARCINLWRGTRWLLRAGRRYKLQTVYN